MTVINRKRGWGGEVKIIPTRTHCCFAKLCSPTKGVSDWCNFALAVNRKPNVSFRHFAIAEKRIETETLQMNRTPAL